MGLDESIGGDIDIWFIPNTNNDIINKSGKNQSADIRAANSNEIKIIKAYTNDMIMYTKQFYFQTQEET